MTPRPLLSAPLSDTGDSKSPFLPSASPNGAVLFWVDREANLYGDGEPVLHDVIVTRVDGTWRPMSSASSTMEPWADLLASFPPGLHRVGEAPHPKGPSLRFFVTWAIATPAVVLVRLRNADGEVRARPSGRHGFVLPRVTSEDPLTSVHAVSQEANSSPANRSRCGLRQGTRRSTPDCGD